MPVIVKYKKKKTQDVVLYAFHTTQKLMCSELRSVLDTSKLKF